MTEVNGLLCSISSPLFITAFQLNRKVFTYTKGLSYFKVQLRMWSELTEKSKL